MTDGNQQSDETDAGAKSCGPGADVLQYLLQTSALPLVAINLQGKLEYYSAYVPELLEVEPGSLADFNMLEMRSDRDRSVLKAHLERVIVEKQAARCEVELKLPNQGTQWVRLVSHPAANEKGTFQCWSILENLTRVRHLEKTEALYQRASEIIGKSETVNEFSQKVFDLLKVLFGIQNGYVAMYDKSHDNVMFPFFTDSVDPKPRPRPMAEGLTDYVITTGRMFWLKDEQSASPFVNGRVHVPGSLPSDWIGVPLTRQNQIVGMAAIQTYEKGTAFNSQDIELMLGLANLYEVFLSRMDLEQAQKMMGKAVEQADETIVITDQRGIIQYVNPAFSRKTGFTREQAIGHTLALINSGQHDTAFFEEMWSDIRFGRTWRGRITNRKKDGTLFDEDVVISPIRNKDGDITNFVGVKRDLSSESITEHGALSARRIEVIEKLVESINHDFGNLLMIIRSNAEDIKKQKTDTGGNESDQIIEAVGKSEKLVENVSQLFSSHSKGMGLVKLNELLMQFEPTAQRLIGENHELQLELAPRMEQTRLNWGEIEQVLFSLLMRAAKAMPQGGIVELRTLVVPARKEDAYFFVGDELSGRRKCAVIEIVDNGSSVPRDQWKKIFTDPVDGMDAVCDLIKKQSGIIGIKENTPSGLIFRLYFPLVSGGAPEPVSLAKPKQELPRGSETILLAEDDEGARRVIARMLEDQGYTVLEAENGAMAIRFMLERKDSIHLLITDMMMPDFDGRALSEQSQSLQPGVKSLFVSGYSRSELEADNVLQSGDEIPLLKKPFKREELLLLVRQTLDN